MKTWQKGLAAAGVFGLAIVVFIAIQATAKPPAQLDDAVYQVALLSAQAAVASAKSALAQEQAQARVAEQELRHLSRDQISALALRQPQLLSAEAALKSSQAAHSFILE